MDDKINCRPRLSWCWINKHASFKSLSPLSQQSLTRFQHVPSQRQAWASIWPSDLRIYNMSKESHARLRGWRWYQLLFCCLSEPYTWPRSEKENSALKNKLKRMWTDPPIFTPANFILFTNSSRALDVGLSNAMNVPEFLPLKFKILPCPTDLESVSRPEYR